MLANHFRRFLVLCVVVGLVTAVSVLTAQATPPRQEDRPSRTGIEDIPHYPLAETSEVGLAWESVTVVPASKVAFQSYRHGNWDIFVGNDDGTGQTAVTSHIRADIHPHLNRGNTAVVYASRSDDHDYEIYRVHVNGSNRVALTNNEADDGNPQWSPDGTKIVFESYRDGQAEIYVMNANGSNQVRLTNNGAFDGMPSWSPDGSKIAFSSNRSGAYRIWVMNADGSNPVRLSNQPYSFRPQWSPDGNKIAYDADGNNDSWQELWVMNADGSGQYERRREYNNTDLMSGSWSPDGRYIAYTQIHFVYYQGNWYWDYAYQKAVAVDNYYEAPIRLSQDDRDWYPRWQTDDNAKPQSHVLTLPEKLATTYRFVSWAGQDVGPTGLKQFDIQYRVGTNGAWTDWLTGVNETGDVFPGTPGTTVYFRSRAYDNAFNREEWPQIPDASTTFYYWRVSGIVTDNRGTPLQNKMAHVVPTPLQPINIDAQGTYQGYTLSATPHTFSINHPSYNNLEPTTFNQPDDYLDHAFYLPPSDNLLQNSSFEVGNGQPTSWDVYGDLPVELEEGTYVSGETALALNTVCPDPPCLTTAQIELEFIDSYYQGLVIRGDKSGELHALWYTWGTRIYYSRRSVDGVWIDPILVDQSPSVHYGISLFMEMDSRGTLHAVWVDEEGLKYVYKPEGDTWSTAEVIADVAYGSNSYVSDFEIAPNDGLHLLIRSYVGAFNGLFHQEKLPDGLWQIPQQIWWETVNTPRLAIGHDNSVHVSWRKTYSDDPAGDHLLFYRVRSPERIWQSREILFSEFNHFATNVLALEVDPHGIIHLFWTNSGVKHTMRMPDGTWTAHNDLGGLGHTWEWEIDSQGTIHWIDDLAHLPAHRLYYRQYTYESGWTEPVDLEPGGANREVVGFEIDPNDYFHLITVDFPHTFFYQGTANAGISGMAAVSQQVAIPEDMNAPTLSFMAKARLDFPDDATEMKAVVTYGISTTVVFSETILNDWKQYWIDMTAWQGLTVTVSLELSQDADNPMMQLFLDDVTLGSAYSDIWIGGGGPASAKPGEQVVYYVGLGNRGGVDAQNVTLSLTLPPELIFEEASIAPISTSPLIWNVGELSGHTLGSPLVITLTVAPSAVLMQSVLSEIEIHTTDPEVELANNTQNLHLFIGEQLFLPVINKP